MSVRIRLRRLARRTLERLGLMGPVYRAIERRAADEAEHWPEAVDGIAAPPAELVMLVAGHADLQTFLDQGRHLATFVSTLAERHGLPIPSAGTVVDFGCGCGRLARSIAPEVLGQGGRFIGLDINARLVRWSAAHLPGEYVRNHIAPPAPLDDASVDLLYSVSVFTHLTEARMRSWLAEMRRFMRPGGLCLVSFADEGRIAPERATALRDAGAYASTRALEGSNYLSSYVTTERFRAMAEAVFTVEEIVPSLQSAETLAWAVLRAA